MTKLAITTNPRTLWALTMTLTNPHDAFESFCTPIFFDLYGTTLSRNSDM